jgi:hypothetical protein
MRVFSRPSPTEERWLAVGSAMGTAAPSAEIAARAGGWRSTGILARIALFFLGLAAAGLLLLVMGSGGTVTLLFAGLLAAFTAEALAAGKRLFASGIEEGLCLGGWLLLGGWLVSVIDSVPGLDTGSVITLVLIAAAAAAGLRLLNPLITAVAAVAFVHWAGWRCADLVDGQVSAQLITLLVGCSLAMLALWLGGRTYQRPSHDRMLDWLVAALPLASYAQSVSWSGNVHMRGTEGATAYMVVTAVVLVAVGVTMLVTGLRRRRHAPLLAAMACIVCLAFELLHVLRWLPLEIRLIGGGFTVLLIGIALERYLRIPRNGFTSKSLSSREGPLDLLQSAGAAVLAQQSAPEGSRQEPAVTGGGGRFGGGGSTGSF